MKYIAKHEEPELLKNFKALQNEAGLPAKYDSFGGQGNKAALNAILREEQHEICCYCQQRIDHYLGDKQTGAHNEHLVPQCTDPGDGSIDLDYANIFACCIASQGMKKKSQHCGEAKGNKRIAGSITNPDCENLFKYNLLGEILPNGPFDDWEQYISNYRTLSQEIKVIVDEISILNLNCNSLVDERKKVIETVATWAIGQEPESVRRWLDAVELDIRYPVFFSFIKFILKKAEK